MIRFWFVLVLSSPLDKTLIASWLQAYSEYRQPLRVFFLSCACAAGAIHCIHCNPSHRHPQRFFLCPAPVPLDRILPFTGSSLQAPTEVLSLSCSCTFGLDTTLPFTGSNLQAPTDVLSLSCACTFGQNRAFYWPQSTGTNRRSFSVLRLYLLTEHRLLLAPSHGYPLWFLFYLRSHHEQFCHCVSEAVVDNGVVKHMAVAFLQFVGRFRHLL